MSSTDLTSLFGSPVTAWCYGHTHWFHDLVLHGTRVVSNPHGYPFENKPFQSQFVVDVGGVAT